jgi:hypothetical protein
MDLVVVFFVICAIGWLRKGWALLWQLHASGAGPVRGPVG